jgi:hypothetical protein
MSLDDLELMALGLVGSKVCLLIAGVVRRISAASPTLPSLLRGGQRHR